MKDFKIQIQCKILPMLEEMTCSYKNTLFSPADGTFDKVPRIGRQKFYQLVSRITIRGCSHMMSAKTGGVLTPPPPL